MSLFAVKPVSLKGARSTTRCPSIGKRTRRGEGQGVGRGRHEAGLERHLFKGTKVTASIVEYALDDGEWGGCVPY